MTRPTLVVGVLAVALVACRTGAPQQARAPIPRSAISAQATDPVTKATSDPREEVEALLTSAQDAVIQGECALSKIGLAKNNNPQFVSRPLFNKIFDHIFNHI